MYTSLSDFGRYCCSSMRSWIELQRDIHLPSQRGLNSRRAIRALLFTEPESATAGLGTNRGVSDQRPDVCIGHNNSLIGIRQVAAPLDCCIIR